MQYSLEALADTLGTIAYRASTGATSDLLTQSKAEWYAQLESAMRACDALDPCKLIEQPLPQATAECLSKVVGAEVTTKQVFEQARNPEESLLKETLDSAFLILLGLRNGSTTRDDTPDRLQTIADWIRSYASCPTDKATLKGPLSMAEPCIQNNPSISETDWHDIQKRLLAKRDRGEPFSSLRLLANELGCSDATIRKAIKKSDILQGWKKRSEGPKASPKAVSLSGVVGDSAPRSTEPAPDDVLSDDDVDATMARLINQARPDERAQLNALDEAGRRALVAQCQSQMLDDEPSPLKPDTPGERPRKVMHHKRA